MMNAKGSRKDTLGEENIANGRRMSTAQEEICVVDQTGSSQSVEETSYVMDTDIRKENDKKAWDTDSFIRASLNRAKPAICNTTLDGAVVSSQSREDFAMNSYGKWVKITMRKPSQNNDRGFDDSSACQDQRGASENERSPPNSEEEGLLIPCPQTQILEASAQPHSSSYDENLKHLLEEAENSALTKKTIDDGTSQFPYHVTEAATLQLGESPLLTQRMEERGMPILYRRKLSGKLFSNLRFQAEQGSKGKSMADLDNESPQQQHSCQLRISSISSADAVDREPRRLNSYHSKSIRTVLHFNVLYMGIIKGSFWMSMQAKDRTIHDFQHDARGEVPDAPQASSSSGQDSTNEKRVVAMGTTAAHEYLHPRRTSVYLLRQPVYKDLTARSNTGSEVSRFILKIIQENSKSDQQVVVTGAWNIYRNMLEIGTRMENEYCVRMGDQRLQDNNQILQSNISQTLALSLGPPVIGNSEHQNLDLQHCQPPMPPVRENEPEKRDAAPARNCRRDHLPIPGTDSARQNHNASSTRTIARNNTDEQILQATDEPDSETTISSGQGPAGGSEVLPLTTILAIEFLDYRRTTILPYSARDSIYQSVINGSEEGSEIARMVLKIVCEFDNRRRRVVLPASRLMYRRILERFTNRNQIVQNDVDEHILYMQDEPESETEALPDQCQAGQSEVPFMPTLFAVEYMDHGRTTILPPAVRSSVYQSVVNGSEGDNEVSRATLRIMREYSNRNRRVVIPGANLIYRRIMESVERNLNP